MKKLLSLFLVFCLLAASCAVAEQSVVICLNCTVNGQTSVQFEGVAVYTAIAVPGEGLQAPYYVPKKEDGTPAKFLKALPQFAADRCEGCGRCAESCPTGCITLHEGRPHAEGVCIKCQAFVRRCPAQAVAFADADFLSHVRMLEQNFSAPARNTFWE